MPLSQATLSNAILNVIDKTASGFVGFPIVRQPSGAVDLPATNTLVAQNWSNVALQYYTQLLVPVLAPEIHAVARTAFETTMGTFLSNPAFIASGLAAKALSAGFGAYAAALAPGLVLPGTVVPPVGAALTIVVPPIPSPLPSNPQIICVNTATSMAATIDAWSRTGVYITPAGVSSNWS